jgi:uncharacterized SAM-binding protein YcdF (DUF218 family)
VIQAILVLGHLMDSDGRLSEQSLSRCSRAAELARERRPSFIFSSGAAYRADSNLALGNVIQAQLKALIDPKSTTFVSDTNSKDTVGDAFYSKSNLSLPNGVERLFVVTSLFHRVRSRDVFRFIYGDALEIEVLTDHDRGTDEQRKHELKALSKFQNSISGLQPGDDRTIEAVLMSNHPLYSRAKD